MITQVVTLVGRLDIARMNVLVHIDLVVNARVKRSSASIRAGIRTERSGRHHDCTLRTCGVAPTPCK